MLTWALEYIVLYYILLYIQSWIRGGVGFHYQTTQNYTKSSPHSSNLYKKPFLVSGLYILKKIEDVNPQRELSIKLYDSHLI